MKTIPHQITREELEKMLERRNFQYGELSNKYAQLKEKYEKLKKQLGNKIKELDVKAVEHCFKMGKMCDECWERKKPLMELLESIDNEGKIRNGGKECQMNTTMKEK